MISESERIIALLESLPAELRHQAVAVVERYANRDLNTGPFGWQLGLYYTERGPGYSRCAIDVDQSHHNPGGIAHGGLVFTLVDSAMGAAVHTLLDPGQKCVTAEIKLNYLAPVVSGTTTAYAKVVSKRRRLAVVTAEVHDQSGELISIAQATFAIIESPKVTHSES